MTSDHTITASGGKEINPSETKVERPEELAEIEKLPNPEPDSDSADQSKTPSQKHKTRNSPISKESPRGSLRGDGERKRKSSEVPKEILEAKAEYRELQKESAALEDVEDSVVKAEEALETANKNRTNKLALHLAKLAVINRTVGNDPIAQTQFLEGLTIKVAGKDVPLIVTSRSSFEATLIRGTHRWLEEKGVTISKQSVTQHACVINLMNLEMPDGSAQEIAERIKGEHTQKTGSKEKSLAGAITRWRWLKEIVDLRERETLARETAGGAPLPNDRDPDDQDVDDASNEGTDQGADDQVQGGDDSFTGTEEELLETHIQAVKDCAPPLKGQQASDLTTIKRFALIPVVIEADNIYVGFKYAEEDVSAFNKFMDAAEIRTGS